MKTQTKSRNKSTKRNKARVEMVRGYGKKFVPVKNNQSFRVMKTLTVDFPNHVQLHELNADGNVKVTTIKKTELSLPIETKPEVNQPRQTI